jgi:hypothetical protein
VCHVDGPTNAVVVLLSRVYVIGIIFTLDRPASTIDGSGGLGNRGMRTSISGVVSGTLHQGPGLAVGVLAPTSGQESELVAPLVLAPAMAPLGTIRHVPFDPVPTIDGDGVAQCDAGSTCRWSFDVGTGHAVTVDAALVQSVTKASQLLGSFEPLMRGGGVPRCTKTVGDITAKLTELEQLFNPRSNEETANALCSSFTVFPDEVVTQDLASLRRLGSLELVIAEKQARTAALGFNVDGVRATVSPNFPRFDQLVDLAERGADVFLPPTFVATTSPPKPRTNLTRLTNVFRYHA